LYSGICVWERHNEEILIPEFETKISLKKSRLRGRCNWDGDLRRPLPLIITVGDTYAGFRAIGFSLLYAVLAVIVTTHPYPHPHPHPHPHTVRRCNDRAAGAWLPDLLSKV